MKNVLHLLYVRVPNFIINIILSRYGGTPIWQSGPTARSGRPSISQYGNMLPDLAT